MKLAMISARGIGAGSEKPRICAIGSNGHGKMIRTLGPDHSRRVPAGAR